ncbi:hypothetical protein [Comamonas aquatica]|uniref:hypothetical protein n=1 Tax=Comamonas aquatica TaxID=225991 RepID=UPI001B3903CB|nr:hypothetical protein [Comamonas aquatica]QTX19447.1 hypothetical protein KAQ61_10105 [Comamonas aquatica]
MTQRTRCRAQGAPICNISLISAGAHRLGISDFFCAGCEIEIGDGVAAIRVRPKNLYGFVGPVWGFSTDGAPVVWAYWANPV